MVHEIKEKNLFQTIRQSAKEIGYKTISAYSFMALVIMAITVTFALSRHQQSVLQHASGNGAFLETFDGAPTSPQPFTNLNQNTWDVTVSSRDPETWDTLEPMEAHHGADCGAPLDATGKLVTHHDAGGYDDAVFHCANHVMTSIKAGGYGVIYLTPNQLVDFSNGTTTVKFDLSTLRSSTRDWIDIFLSPYADNMQLPLENWLPDLQGLPKNGIHIRMDNFGGGSGFRVSIVRNYVETEITTDTYAHYEQILTPSPKDRTTFQLDISKTHIKFGIPPQTLTNNQSMYWADTDIAPLSWSQGVLQLGHHSYNPDKACDYDGTCGADTWHWDNVSISNAVPFTMIKADKRFVNDPSQAVTFQSPAPANANLRFSGEGVIQVSFNNGSTWQPAVRQMGDAEVSGSHHAEHFSSYWMPIPQGTQSVKFKFANDDWYQGPFRAKDFAIWSLTPGSAVTPIPTAITPLPTVGTPSLAPTNTPTVAPTAVVPSPTGVISALSTLSFAPATQSVTTGQTFTAQVRINTNGQTVNAVQSDILYPSNLLSIASISNTSGDFDVEVKKTNANGVINLVYGATVPKSGNLLVATITFKALASGNAAVSFSNPSVISSVSNTNVLKSATGGNYTIVSPTPTPTATPLPTATPTPSSVPTKVGDMNHDGKIDAQDLSYLLTHWGSTDAVADLNHDGKVNTLDLSALLSNWGK